jgi:hypothetical protein
LHKPDSAVIRSEIASARMRISSAARYMICARSKRVSFARYDFAIENARRTSAMVALGTVPTIAFVYGLRTSITRSALTCSPAMRMAARSGAPSFTSASSVIMFIGGENR